ncbi:MAG: hypothetical protein KGL39_38530 [Patescibacteria group bacterium]|nr:hypothetical protein [Patescibacteria group bacterium]
MKHHAYYAASTSRSLEIALLVIVLFIAALVVGALINRAEEALLKRPDRLPSPFTTEPHVVTPLRFRRDELRAQTTLKGMPTGNVIPLRSRDNARPAA